MRILANVIIFLLIMVVSVVIALLALDPLSHMGLFGSCFEGACGYAAIFVGFPLITLALTAVGCVIWFMLRRR